MAQVLAYIIDVLMQEGFPSVKRGTFSKIKSNLYIYILDPIVKLKMNKYEENESDSVLYGHSYIYQLGSGGI